MMPVMRRTLLAASLVIGSSSVAFAQVPGDYSGPSGDDGYGAPGMVQPQPMQPVVLVQQNPCSCLDVMANRWSVGLDIGSVSTQLANTANDPTNYDVGELSLRFRISPRFELEGVIGGGGEAQRDNNQGNRTIQTASLNARIRFNPYGHWNWFLMGGIGEVAMSYDGASKDEIDASRRPMVSLGVGLEHRWNQFALQAQLKFGAIGPTKNDQMVATPQADGSVGYTSSNTDDTYTAGTFTIGAGYYF